MSTTSGINLKGRVALVTGAVEGIGWETAKLLGTQGCAVVMVGRAVDERAEARRAELTALGVDADVLQADVTDAAQVAKSYQFVFKKHGRLDILVANAGVLGDARIGMISEDLLHTTIETNLLGAIRNLQAAARLMSRQRTGSIVLLSSIVGIAGNTGQVAYAASKAGIHGVVRSAAKELGPLGVRVNAIAPGFIHTRMISHLSAELHDQRVGLIPMGRPGEPSEVAGAILFLVSDLASYVTGQILGVDGGMII